MGVWWPPDAGLCKPALAAGVSCLQGPLQLLIAHGCRPCINDAGHGAHVQLQGQYGGQETTRLLLCVAFAASSLLSRMLAAWRF